MHFKIMKVNTGIEISPSWRECEPIHAAQVDVEMRTLPIQRIAESENRGEKVEMISFRHICKFESQPNIYS